MNSSVDKRILKAQAFTMAMGRFDLNPVPCGPGSWYMWYSTDDLRRCSPCMRRTGKIYDKTPNADEQPPAHDNCRCIIDSIQTILAGTATVDRKDGADYHVYHYKELPDEYITKNEARIYGWSEKKKLRTVLPGRVLGGDIYLNDEGKLPNAPGRIWYEADINYLGFKRSPHRLLYSSDGLVFVTYDHYETYFEITGGTTTMYRVSH